MHGVGQCSIVNNYSITKFQTDSHTVVNSAPNIENDFLFNFVNVVPLSSVAMFVRSDIDVSRYLLCIKKVMKYKNSRGGGMFCQ